MVSLVQNPCATDGGVTIYLNKKKQKRVLQNFNLKQGKEYDSYPALVVTSGYCCSLGICVLHLLIVSVAQDIPSAADGGVTI